MPLTLQAEIREAYHWLLLAAARNHGSAYVSVTKVQLLRVADVIERIEKEVYGRT